MSAAHKRKLREAMARRKAGLTTAASGNTGGTDNTPQRPPRTVTDLLRALVNAARPLTSEQFQKQIEGFAQADSTIGWQADRHVLQQLANSLQTYAGQRTMSHGGGIQS